MKIRQGFISNSSSSSFIVRKENQKEAIKYLNEHHIGYYIFKDILYTPYICDGLDEHTEMLHSNLFEELYEGGHGYPYNEEDFIEVETDYDSVWIPKEGLTAEELIALGDVPIQLASELYMLLKNYFEGNSTFTKDNILEECKNYVVFNED